MTNMGDAMQDIRAGCQQAATPYGPSKIVNLYKQSAEINRNGAHVEKTKHSLVIWKKGEYSPYEDIEQQEEIDSWQPGTVH